MLVNVGKIALKGNTAEKEKYHGNQHSNKKTAEVVSDITTEASRSTKSRRKSVVIEDDKKKTASHKKLKTLLLLSLILWRVLDLLICLF